MVTDKPENPAIMAATMTDRHTGCNSTLPAREIRELVVWRRALELVAESYRITAALPAAERYGISVQLQRAALSVPTNIAEGRGRLSRGDFARFISIARGSVKEVETLLEVIELLNLADASDLTSARSLAEEVSRMLSILLRRLRQPP